MGSVRPRAVGPHSPREKAGLAAEIVAAYVRARRAIRHDDVRTAISQLRAGTDSDGGQVPAATVAEAARLGRVVQRVLRVLPVDSRCLAQSLVLTDLLSRRAVASRLVIGVKPGEEFGAHAWVELGGTPVLPPGGDDFARLVEI